MDTSAESNFNSYSKTKIYNKNYMPRVFSDHRLNKHSSKGRPNLYEFRLQIFYLGRKKLINKKMIK